MSLNGYYRQRAVMLAFALILMSVPNQVQGQTSDGATSSIDRSVTFAFESDLVSKYVWHGLEFSEAGVWQQTLSLSARHLIASVWTNYDPAAETNRASFNEVDASLAYELSYLILTFEPSFQMYLYPNQPAVPWTAELSFGLTAALPVVSPFMRHTFDVKEYVGSYFGEFGLCVERSLGGAFALDASTEIGWASSEFNTAYVGAATSGIQLFQIDGGITCLLTGSFYVRPHWCWTDLSGAELRKAVERPQLHQFGIELGGQF